MIESQKNTIYSTLFIVGITIGLSVFFGVAYIYSLCGLSAWVAFGHLITLDDDMPGEWSNPDGDKKMWRASLSVLVLKFLIFIALVVIVLLLCCHFHRYLNSVLRYV